MHVLSYPTMNDLATEIRRFSGSGEGRVDWKQFPDGTPDLFIHNIPALREQNAAFLMDAGNMAAFVPQHAVICALAQYGVGELMVIVPYFPGTMDRVDIEGQVATAKTLARLLSSVPSPAKGKLEVVIYDIHNLAERFFFGDNVIVRCESAMPLLQSRLLQKQEGPVEICFPDEGACKRFKRLLFKTDRYGSPIICDKRRIGDQRQVVIKEGDPTGKDIVIVDDMIMSGATLRECARVLRAAGAKSVRAFAMHGVFPTGSIEAFGNELDGIWVTDSCPSNVSRPCRVPIETLSLGPLIAKLLKE